MALSLLVYEVVSTTRVITFILDFRLISYSYQTVVHFVSFPCPTTPWRPEMLSWLLQSTGQNTRVYITHWSADMEQGHTKSWAMNGTPWADFLVPRRHKALPSLKKRLLVLGVSSRRSVCVTCVMIPYVFLVTQGVHCIMHYKLSKNAILFKLKGLHLFLCFNSTCLSKDGSAPLFPYCTLH